MSCSGVFLMTDHEKIIVDREIDRRRDVMRSNNRRSNARFFLHSSPSIFRYVFIFILCVSVLRSVFVAPDDYFTFGQFLNFLQNVPDITSDVSKAVSNMVTYSVIGEVPSWLNWMDYLIKPFLTVLSFFVYIAVGLGQVLVFVTYFVRFFFGG